MFPCEICEVFKNNIFTEHLLRMLLNFKISSVSDAGLVRELLLWWTDKRYILPITTFCWQVLSVASVITSLASKDHQCFIKVLDAGLVIELLL